MFQANDESFEIVDQRKYKPGEPTEMQQYEIDRLVTKLHDCKPASEVVFLFERQMYNDGIIGDQNQALSRLENFLFQIGCSTGCAEATFYALTLELNGNI